MDFLVLPPEVNSARMYLGAGSGSMLEAAAAWDGLAGELGSAASSFGSVTSGLAGAAWQGPAAVAMAGAASPYVGWLEQRRRPRHEGAAGQARAAASAFEAAVSATVHPAVVAANRSQLVSLVRSNVLGFNAPAIAAAEAQYEEMWAADVSAMVGYHGGASAVAAQLAPMQQALQTLPGPLGQVQAAMANINLGPGNIGGGNLGSGNRGSGNLGSGNQGNANLGSGNTGNSNVGNGNNGNANVGSGNAGSNNFGFGNNGSGNIGSGNIMNGNLGSGNNGTSNVGVGNTGNLNRGIGNNGINNMGFGNLGNNNIGFGNTRQAMTSASG